MPIKAFVILSSFSFLENKIGNVTYRIYRVKGRKIYMLYGKTFRATGYEEFSFLMYLTYTLRK